MPSALKTSNHEFRVQQRGRAGVLIARQQEIHAQLAQDPLLDLATVRAVLGCSYGKLNKLLHDRVIPFWQPVKFSERKVRQSALAKYLAAGDLHAEVKADG